MELERLLSSDPVSANTIHALRTAFVPLQMFDSDVAAHGLLSREQEYDAKHTFPPKNAFNHLIGSLSDDIEVILAENDIALRDQLVEGFAKETAEDLADINLDRYHKLLEEMLTSSSSRSNKKKSKIPSPFDLNGASSDHRLWKEGTPSTGPMGDYWAVSDRCIKAKGCSTYPIFRVLHRSKSSKSTVSSTSNPLSFSCHDIHTLLMPQIYDCIDRHGVNDCPLVVGHGHFRWVFKALIPKEHGGDGQQFVAIKMMKASSGEVARDLLRHLRESVFLYYLRSCLHVPCS